MDYVPVPLLPLPTLRRRRLLTAIRKAGYDLRVTQAGPDRRLVVMGPTSKLNADQVARIQAAHDDLVADLDTQAEVEREVVRLIERLEGTSEERRFPVYVAALNRMVDAYGAGLLSLSQYRSLFAHLDSYSTSFPWPVPPPRAGSHAGYDWPDDNAIARCAKRTGVVLGKSALGDPPGKKRRRRQQSEAAPESFGFAAAAQLRKVCPLDADEAEGGDLIGVVPTEADVPSARERHGAQFVWYTNDELAALRGLTPEEMASIHYVKREMDGEVRAVKGR